MAKDPKKDTKATASPAGQSDKAKDKKPEDLIEKAFLGALAGVLTNAQKLDIASSFKKGQPVNISGTIAVNGARLPFYTVVEPPKIKKKK